MCGSPNIPEPEPTPPPAPAPPPPPPPPEKKAIQEAPEKKDAKPMGRTELTIKRQNPLGGGSNTGAGGGLNTQRRK
jgi:hypothetical protein